MQNTSIHNTQILVIAYATTGPQLTAQLYSPSMAKRAKKPTPPKQRSLFPKRAYSKNFPSTEPRRYQLMADHIPASLARRVKAKSKREGVSIRALVLGFLAEWCRDEPDVVTSRHRDPAPLPGKSRSKGRR